MPRPPEYCGSTAVMPNSGREVADRRAARPGPGAGTSGPRRGTPRGRARPRRAARRTPRRPPARRSAPVSTSPSNRTGSRPVDSHSSGSTDGEDVLGGRVPGPPQVVGQFSERGERLGEHGADGESSDGAHPQTLARALGSFQASAHVRSALDRSSRVRGPITQPAHLSLRRNAGGCDMGTRPPVSPSPGVPRSQKVGNAPSRRDLARLEKWSDASPSWTSCPSSTSVDRRPRRRSASPSRCARPCSARVTTGSPPRWCSPPPTAAGGHPCG